MLRLISKEEREENKKELQQFCKGDHYSWMYNTMRDIKNLINEGEQTEQTRIINVIKKMRIDKGTKEKVINAIKERDKKKAREWMKKYHKKYGIDQKKWKREFKKANPHLFKKDGEKNKNKARKKKGK